MTSPEIVPAPPDIRDGIRGILVNRATAWVVLVCSVALTALAWQVSSRIVEERARDRFAFEAADIRKAIENRLNQYVALLRGGVGLFASSQSVEREEWRSYVASLNIERNFPGVQGLGYSLWVRPDDFFKVTDQVRAEGFPDFHIWPDYERGDYSTILYLEPFSSRNIRAFGYDMFSEPVRREAMIRARDSGQEAMSGMVKLVQETATDVQKGFLIYVPDYRPGLPLDTVEQRRAALRGFVYSPFRMKDLMHGVLATEKKTLSFEIFDGDRPTPDTLLYDDDEPHPLDFGSHDHTMSATHLIEVGGHRWTLYVYTHSGYLSAADTGLPVIVATAGGIINLLLFLVIHTISGQRQRALALATDMTRELRRSEGRLRAIVDNTVDGIIVIDPDGVIQSVNRAVERIFQYHAQEMIGANVKMLMPEPYRGQHDAYLRRYRETGERHIIGIGREVHGQRRDGEVFPLDLAVNEVRTVDGLTYVGVVRDITERKAVDRMKNEFVSTVSHELRTPLTSIMGSLGLVRGGAVGEVPERAKQLIDIAYTNSDRLVRLINDILDMEKIESGRMDFHMDRIDVPALLAEALKAMRGYGESHEVAIDVTAAPAGAAVEGDHDRLLQVLTNLIGNAVKFSPAGRRVEVAARRTQDGILFSVRDFGPGIAESFRSRVFTRFSQADSSDTRKKGGTGLGLSICKAIVERHQGTIWFETESGRGTTFLFVLPEEAAQAGNGAAARASVPPMDWMTHPLDPERLRDHLAQLLPPGDHRPRILHVEDDPDVLTVVAGIVGDLASVVPAHSLAEGRALLAAADFDLMILDLSLPDGTGEALLAELDREDGMAVPTIVFSVEAPPAALSGRLAAALLKSRTSNETLRAIIHSQIAKEGGSS